jgi:hypothetical protein
MSDWDDIQRILDVLNTEWGKWKLSKKGHKFRAIDDNDRYEVIKIILQTFKEEGKDLSAFGQSSTQNKIAAYFFPDSRLKSASASTQRNIYEKVAREIREAIIEINGAPQNITSKELNSPIIEQPKPVTRSETPIRRAEPETEVKFAGRDVDRSLYKDISDFEPELDPEMAELVGIKKNE